MSEISDLYSVPPCKDLWRGASRPTRQKWFKNALIIHPRFRKAIEITDMKLQRCKDADVGDAFFIEGETGSGKTWLIDFFCRRSPFANKELTERSIRPVIRLKVPGVCTPKQFCVDMLKCLEDPLPEKGTYTQLKARVIALFRECQVQLVLLDDLQDIPLKRSARGVENIVSCIRDFIDETCALFVMLGNRTAAVVLDSNSQLRKRAAYRLQLKYFDLREVSRLAEFKKLMSQLDSWLPLAESSCITDGLIMGRIFCATNGIFQFIIQLLDYSWPEAVKDGRETLIISDLYTGFANLYGDVADTLNPFSQSFTPRSLDKPGEPFFAWQ